MNPEKQRIAIAEACGWRIEYIHGNGMDCDVWVDPEGLIREECPDYLNDLNAMHEAEKALTELQRGDYSHELLRMVAIRKPYNPRSMAWCHMDFFQVTHATAAQRAEAFLKTINKWNNGS